MYVSHGCNAASLTSCKTRNIFARIVRGPPAIIIQPEYDFPWRRRTIDTDKAAMSGETGKTTTTDVGTAALSIIQYYSLSKSEKPGMVVGSVVTTDREAQPSCCCSVVIASVRLRAIQFDVFRVIHCLCCVFVTRELSATRYKFHMRSE